MTRARRLVGPGLMALAMLLVLLGLGGWQVRRLHWKQGILAAIDRAEAAAPVPLPDHPLPFQKVAISGRLVAGSTLLYGADVRDTQQGPQPGAQLIQPLLRANGPAVLVDRGWVEVSPTGIMSDVPPQPQGEATYTGYVRPPDHPHLFSPHDDLVARRVYTLDPAAMSRALGLARVAPFTLVLLGGNARSGEGPDAATALPRPPNDHLSYAITWFGLALVLVVVFTLWAARRLRED